MKRRNADCGKIRRPVKRNKIAEQIGSNTVLYVKFLMLWALVITADFLVEFRFEFLWPFWLLLRSVYDSFKYKGLAFSVLFVCIAITSDLVCLFFIPVQWLFFAASTYVWVQYVWHTDKGICLPTIFLWILFVYLEAAIRWKDSRNIPHLDLCRPFAAHCIGYPVVTLGFGFKSYVGYRIRQRKQREVAKDNDFYMQLLQEALPKDESASSAASTDANQSADQHQQDHQLSPVQQKEISVTTASPNSSSSSSSISNSNGGSGSGNSHTHHQHHHSSKNAQNHSKSQSNVTSTSHVNGHAGGGSSSVPVSNSSTGTSTLNGGVGHSKHLHRKSLDKESSSSISGKGNNNNSNPYHQQQTQPQQQNSTNNNNNNNNSSSSAKDSSRTNDSSQTNGAAMSPKEKKDCESTGPKAQPDGLSTANSQPNSKAVQANDSNHDTGASRSKHQQNGHVVNLETEQPQQQQQNHVENCDPPVEQKSSRSGRKNRVKQKDNSNHLATVRLAATLALASSITTLTTTAAASTVATTTTSVASKDNHLHHNSHDQQQQQQQQQNTAASNATVSNNTQSDNSTPAGSTANGSSTPATTSTPTGGGVAAPPPVQTVKVCETCSRMEMDAKKLRSELSSLKQSENENRQKYDSISNNLKTSLQVKQKDYDELQNKFQDLTTQRLQERQNLQTVERRLGEERRHRQSLESQVQNERKHRKLAEEKAARPECGEPCKLKRQQMDMEIQKLRRDLISSEEAKHNAEKQNRNYEQELRKFEAQLRNRESQQNAEVLMSALAAMQDKNTILEKNLSAETRVKLDLFSALGDARRQIEIVTCSLRTKEKEILDLKAKIVQLVAVMPSMPNDSLCLTGPGPSATGGGGGSSMMRLTDAPQLLTQSPMNGQPSPMSHIVMNSPPLISQLSNLGVLTSTITTSTAAMSCGGAPANVMAGGVMGPPSVQQNAPGVASVAAVPGVASPNGQIVQMQNSSNCPSNLDPNASIYTPKNCSSMVGGTEA